MIQTREIDDISFIDIEIDWLNFKETNLLPVYLEEIKYILDWEYSIVDFNKENIIQFWDDIYIYKLLWGIYLLEYKENFNLEKEIASFKYEYKNSWYFSEELGNWRQVPELSWYFEYNWSKYLLINAKNKLTDENNVDKGIYKWVIVSPSKYFEVENQVKDTSWQVKETLNEELKS